MQGRQVAAGSGRAARLDAWRAVPAAARRAPLEGPGAGTRACRPAAVVRLAAVLPRRASAVGRLARAAQRLAQHTPLGVVNVAGVGALHGVPLDGGVHGEVKPVAGAAALVRRGVASPRAWRGAPRRRGSRQGSREQPRLPGRASGLGPAGMRLSPWKKARGRPLRGCCRLAWSATVPPFSRTTEHITQFLSSVASQSTSHSSSLQSHHRAQHRA